jgi:hypothetical protein
MVCISAKYHALASAFNLPEGKADNKKVLHVGLQDFFKPIFWNYPLTTSALM